jgi:dTDP-4-dehydrorhamnose reductase
MDTEEISHPPILITGASGLVGSCLCALAASRWRVFGTFCRQPPRQIPKKNGVELVQIDLTHWNDTQTLLEQVQPKAVIHAAAAADVTRCQHHPEQTADINIRVPALLAAWCARHGVPFAHLSTDLVFDGTRPPYDESSRVNPLGIYAIQKARAEADVAARSAEAVIFRLPLMVGISESFGHHFCQQMLRAIDIGDTLTLFTDEYRTPVDIRSAARGILDLTGKVEGIVHLGGTRRISRYELGVMMANAMSRSIDQIKGIPIAQSALSVPRARDVSLNSQMAFSLGYSPTALEEAVQAIVAQYLAIPSTPTRK